MKKVVVTSGYYNPVHVGHINLMREAKKMGDFLVVIVNNDEQVMIKGSVPFMPEQERIEIVKAFSFVDEVVLSVDKDGTVIKTLEKIFNRYKNKKLFFAKGGDSTMENVPESFVCEKFSAELILKVGGGKVQSSSWLIEKSYQKSQKV